MKKIRILIVLVATSFYSQAQTAEEILAKLTTALGGDENLNAIKTLQYNSSLKLSFSGFPIEVNITQTKEKQKLSRTDFSGIMGMQPGYTLCTDTAVYVSTPSLPSMGSEFGGMQGGIKKLDESAVQNAKPQLNCNGYFIALLNYKETNSKISFIGTEKYNKAECFKLQLINANNEKMVYFINAVTNLIDKCEANAASALAALTGGIGGGMGAMAMMGGDMKNTKVTIVYSDYVSVNNVKFPTKEVLQIGANDIELSHNNFVINEAINPKLYLAN